MEAPAFAQRSDVVERAFEYTQQALENCPRDDPSGIEHPVEVAALLHEAGFGDDVVAAGLLHDVVEDTEVDIDELERSFGPRIGFLVGTMTEDESIESYPARKADHRSRVVRGGPPVAAIFVADKLAKVRELQRGGEDPPARKVQHYRDTVQAVGESYPELPYLRKLDGELKDLERRTSGVAGGSD
jgi:(p)ppGpp synthase/HD superfamily hydrolase